MTDVEAPPERPETLSGQLISGARQVSQGSDEFFVTAVVGVGSGLNLAAEGLGIGIGLAAQGVVGLGRRLSPWSLAVRLGLRREETTRDRIRSLLIKEARLKPIEVTREEFDEFSEKMGILFELIFQGVIKIEDIVLESDDDPESEADLAPVPDEGDPNLQGVD
ncbi:MAG: hypothetical protein DRJ42_28910 [Deltaproteobacteria bacterium]|nr:MAG: hypothetical protein DRJ42_28910 [Deltaproteobacteria bacterium]